ncbi:hypothetical protein [Halodurantibacterium flavum]|uniref:Uncharacterized protein n=1 Tax=Halodurantibacterium flavum TaxID=1382802 RepID=A0ABW4S7M7_9RHOB
MAKANSKHHGIGTHGKGDGTGALSEADISKIPANSVLSNRDKAQHTPDRGLDGRNVQTEQYHDHTANRRES